MRTSAIVHRFDIKSMQAPMLSSFHTNLRFYRRTNRITYLTCALKTAYSTYKETCLHGRTAMITGGSSGIGYAIAERFLQEGASKVILVGRRPEKLQDASKRLAESILHQPGQSEGRDGELATRAPEDDSDLTAISSNERIGYVVGDVSVANEWMGELEKEMANVDILINAAGISTSNLLLKTSTDSISETLKTNLEGAIYTSRAMLKACMRARLKKKKEKKENINSPPTSKCIINISSLLALKGVTGTVAYSASKAGLLGLTRTMAVEAADILKGSNVFLRCNTILPGYISTPLVQDFSSDKVNALRELIPMNRFGRPEEVADAAVFLSTNEYANNCVLNLDGGLSAV